MDQRLKENADTLVVCLVHNTPLRNRVMEIASRLDLFDPLVLPTHALIWDVLRKAYSVVGQTGVITPFHVSESVREQGGEPETVEEALQLMEAAREVDPSEVVEEIGLRYFEQFHVGAAKRDMLKKLSQAYTREDLMAMINNEQQRLDRATVTDEVSVEHPLMDPVRFMPTSIKIPTGVRWIDHLSFGGHSTGEVVGILAPTGGGKTLTATQLLMAQAWRHNHALLATYEQPLSGDIAERIYCQAFNDRSVDFFRNTPPHLWSREDKIRYAELRDQFGKYLHVLDFAKGRQGGNGVQDLRDAVEALEEINQKPTYLLIDWLWPAARRYCIAHGIPLETGMRARAQAIIADLKVVCTEKSLIGLIFHQLNTELSRASPARIPVVTDAYELKDFSFMLDACYVIGNRDKESQVMWLGTDKNRRGAPQHVLGKMDGARGRIELAQGVVYDARQGFIPAEQAKAAAKVPTENMTDVDPYI